MFRCLYKWLFVALLLVPLVSIADESRQALSELTDKVVVKTLSNGVKVLFYQRGEAPIFSSAVAVRVGGADERPGITGISHMLEHMAFKGSKSVGTKDYEAERKLLEQVEVLAQKEIKQGRLSNAERAEWERLHAQLAELWDVGEFMRRYAIHGAKDSNATTAKDFTTYTTSMPRSAFEFWANAESDRLLNPVMRQFYQERDVVMEERRMRSDDDPSGRLYEALLDKAYTIHPYRYPVIGYPQDLRRLNASQTDAFHKRYYVGRNIAVALVGMVDPERDLKLLEETFGRIPQGEEISRPADREPAQTAERHFILQGESDPQILMAYHKPNYPHPDDPALSVMVETLAGGKLSPLYKELVEKQRLTSGIGYTDAPDNGYPNLMLFYGEIKAPHTNKEWLSAFDRVLAQFIQQPPSPEAIEIAKRAIAMDFLNNIRSNLSLAVDLAQSELLYGGFNVSLEWYDQAMAVTPEDVLRVARQYLRPSNRTIGFLERK